ncbi:MAG: 50S ribosomal protein L4 [Armatimonadota bacterium]
MAIKTKSGKKGGDVVLSEKVFGAPRNIALMHQAVRAEFENSRQDTRNAPGRGDMLGGGKKPWRQKGTGRARQGSIIAPHWRKGGAAHGPHPRALGHSIPRKMRRAAIWSALSAKLADGELVVIDTFGLKDISTKEAAEFLAKVNNGARKSLVILEESDPVVVKSLRNIPGVTLRVAPVVSTRDVVDGGIVVATKAAALKLDATWSGNEEATDA